MMNLRVCMCALFVTMCATLSFGQGIGNNAPRFDYNFGEFMFTSWDANIELTDTVTAGCMSPALSIPYATSGGAVVAAGDDVDVPGPTLVADMANVQATTCEVGRAFGGPVNIGNVLIETLHDEIAMSSSIKVQFDEFALVSCSGSACQTSGDRCASARTNAMIEISMSVEFFVTDPCLVTGGVIVSMTSDCDVTSCLPVVVASSRVQIPNNNAQQMTPAVLGGTGHAQGNFGTPNIVPLPAGLCTMDFDVLIDQQALAEANCAMASDSEVCESVFTVATLIKIVPPQNLNNPAVLPAGFLAAHNVRFSDYVTAVGNPVLLDMNQNGVLDSVEIAFDPTVDANVNTILDTVEVDADGDGTPDSCQGSSGL
ncbi:MAG: hypothetical protein AAF432_01790 [Planctomycetota bacterium]